MRRREREGERVRTKQKKIERALGRKNISIFFLDSILCVTFNFVGFIFLVAKDLSLGYVCVFTL